MKFGSGTSDGGKKSGDISGFFGEGVEVVGEVRFTETLRVDGKVRANIHGEGELVIGPKGEVDGEVVLGSLSVSGRIKGTLRVKERLEVHSGGRVEGEILLGRPGLVVNDGGVVEAKIQMGTVKESGAPAASRAQEPHPSSTR